MLRVLIADDHPVVRKGLIEVVARAFPGVVCGEANDGHQVLQSVQQEPWDILILDIEMPGMGGLEVLGALKHLRPKLPVLVLSFHPEEQYGKRALKGGASGYLHKGSSPQELTRAIQVILAGKRYLSPALAEKLADSSLDGDDRPPHEKLSDREFAILRLLGSGKSVTQIAAELHLGVPTVGTYRARILAKMNLTTTAELIHYAVSNHLVD